MRLPRRILASSLAVAAISIGAPSMAEQQLEAGQVWTFHDATPATSRVIIGKIDSFEGEDEAVVSISVTDAPIPTTESRLQVIQHLPVAESVLRRSLMEQTGKIDVPAGFMDGYQTWRRAFDNGKGGYFTLPVDKIVEYVGKAVRQPQGNAGN